MSIKFLIVFPYCSFNSCRICSDIQYFISSYWCFMHSVFLFLSIFLDIYWFYWFFLRNSFFVLLIFCIAPVINFIDFCFYFLPSSCLGLILCSTLSSFLRSELRFLFWDFSSFLNKHWVLHMFPLPLFQLCNTYFDMLYFYFHLILLTFKISSESLFDSWII